jgi:hypothetical protein
LIFVRRVATAYELEQRLLKKYEQEYITPKLNKLNSNRRYKSKELNQLLNRFSNRKLIAQLPELFKLIYKRVQENLTIETIEFLNQDEFEYYKSIGKKNIYCIRQVCIVD